MNEIITGQTAIYRELLSNVSLYSVDIQKITKEKQGEQIYWNNGFLPGFDIIMLYTILSEKKPNRFVEVGSGHSTKVAHLAKHTHSPQTQIVSIDPQPRVEINHLADQVIRRSFETLDMSMLELTKGDILFIDNSHRILPNSDSMVFFMEVLPMLPVGVIVHLHDIYLPFDYPQEMCDRMYNEQYGLAAFLLSNPDRYKPIMPNYFVSQDEELSSLYSAIWNHKNLEDVERHGGSFWLEIC